ncbi:MAG TPA: DegQ family serine endoprotease [Sedimentisphaerales bacterium]|nr:DegQ family serine endoprotease [Sedimentisphaerales bacterium]
MNKQLDSGLVRTIRSMVLPFVLCIGFVAPVFSAQGQNSLQTLREIGDTFTQIAEKASPAVVGIKVEVESQGQIFEGTPGSPFGSPFDPFGDDFFDFFFRGPSPGGSRPQSGQQPRMAQGSGFIISKDGDILTNDHVVGKASKITVKLTEQQEVEAKLVGSDPETDLAVIKVDSGKDLATLQLGDSDKLKVGQWVLAIGSPFGLSHTVTAGIISAKGRSDIHLTTYEDFIQTDAAINPGNSGGPLINLDGEAVGINTAIIGSTGNVGIGLAIPANMAKAVYEQLVKGGKVVRGFLGVSIQDLTPDLAKSFGIKEETRGVLVSEVTKNSPADNAGLKQGDIVIELNDQAIQKASELQYRVSVLKPGTKANLVVLRDNQHKSISVTLGERPESRPTVTGPVSEPEPATRLGIEVQDLTDDLAQRFGYKGQSGVIVTQVTPGSVAAENGITPGTLIVEVNRQAVVNTRDFQKRMIEVAKEGSVLLLVNMQGHSRYVVLKIPKN